MLQKHCQATTSKNIFGRKKRERKKRKKKKEKKREVKEEKEKKKLQMGGKIE